jgi:hypothetical protein
MTDDFLKYLHHIKESESKSDNRTIAGDAVTTQCFNGSHQDSNHIALSFNDMRCLAHLLDALPIMTD